MNEDQLAAFEVQRRSIVAVVFAGEHLDYTQTRQLASDLTRAEMSAVGFARWVTETFQVKVAALEKITGELTTRRATLTELITRSLRTDGVGVSEISKSELLSAYGTPPLRTRRELRAIVHEFWPILPDTKAAGPTLDAAALGLYVQIQRELDI